MKKIITTNKSPQAIGPYSQAILSNKTLYISGQISISENGELIKGKIGKDLTTEDGYKAAERCGLSIVAQAKKACGDNLSKKKCDCLYRYKNAARPALLSRFTDHTEITGFIPQGQLA